LEEKEDQVNARKKLKKNKENSSSNRTIKFRNSKKLSMNYTETNTVTNADFIQKTEKILKKIEEFRLLKQFKKDKIF